MDDYIDVTVKQRVKVVRTNLLNDVLYDGEDARNLWVEEDNMLLFLK